ncbi:MAG: hypothetical protein WCI71_08865, partial [Bacteroidota bacterium]
LQGNSQDSVANDDSAGHLNLMSQPSLFEETESPDHTDSKKNVRGPKKEKGEKRIEKILIFYTDRTFREYDPEN